MVQTYRTNDLTRWGSGKGEDLTETEVDINFWDIIQRVLTLEDDMPDAAVGIDYFEVSGTQFYVHMTDHSIEGPFDLPVATFADKGEWAPSTVYAVLDTFTINAGLYVVIYPHTSDLTFDAGANDGSGHDYYQLMVQTPGSALPTGGAVGQVLQKSTTDDFATTWGWKTPTGGTARQYHIKSSSTQDDSEWDTPQAADIAFTPATGSSITATTVDEAIEQAADATADASDIPYTPSTGSGLTSTVVADALDELGAGKLDAADVVGRQTMWVPASAMISRTTNGPSSGTVETSSNKNMVKTLDFDASTQEFAQFDVAMPKSWDLSSVYFIPYWSHPSTTTNFGVAWGVDAIAISDNEALDVAFGTAQVVTDTGGTTDRLYVGAESSAITVSGTPADGDLVMFRVHRDPANGSDNMAVDARLHGIKLIYVTNAATDT